MAVIARENAAISVWKLENVVCRFNFALGRSSGARPQWLVRMGFLAARGFVKGAPKGTAATTLVLNGYPAARAMPNSPAEIERDPRLLRDSWPSHHTRVSLAAVTAAVFGKRWRTTAEIEPFSRRQRRSKGTVLQAGKEVRATSMWQSVLVSCHNLVKGD